MATADQPDIAGGNNNTVAVAGAGAVADSAPSSHPNDGGTVKVADFDVLSDELPGGDVYVLDDYNNAQIGNNRLKLLIEMNHEAFSIHFNKNDQEECEKVVDQIWQVTVERGRFLTKPLHIDSTSTGSIIVTDPISVGWKVLNEEQSKELVRQALRSPLSEREAGEPLDAYAYYPADDGDDDDDDDDEEDEEHQQGVDDSLEPIPLAQGDEDDVATAADLGVDWADLTSSLDVGINNLELHDGQHDGHVEQLPVVVPDPPPTSTTSPSNGGGNADKKKRGRRQSLLRRSVSESSVDKKKTYRNLSGEVGLSELSGMQPLSPNHYRRYHSTSDPRLATTNSSSILPPPARGLHRAATVSSERNIRQSHDPPSDGFEPILSNFGDLRRSSILEFSPFDPSSLSEADADVEEKADGYDDDDTHDQIDLRQAAIKNGPQRENVIIPKYSGMDIVFRNDCRSLSPKNEIVGNNRLKVMISLKQSSYNTKSSDEQTTIASEIMDVVQNKWKARILVDTGFAYQQLGYADSIKAMKTLLGGPSATAAPTMPSSSSLMSSCTSNGTAASMSVSSSTSSVSSTSSALSAGQKPKNNLLAFAPPVPDFLRNASLEILNGGHRDYPETCPEQMQSAAIRSLQLRKAKRDMDKGKNGATKGGSKKKGGPASSSTTSSSSSSSSPSPTPSSSEKNPPDRTASI
jgi:hypothetical protein